MPTQTQPLAVVWGRNLRAARVQAGLTQVELGSLIGSNQFTISRYESGKHRPADEAKISLARSLETTVEALFPYSHLTEPAEPWPA